MKTDLLETSRTFTEAVGSTPVAIMILMMLYFLPQLIR